MFHPNRTRRIKAPVHHGCLSSASLGGGERGGGAGQLPGAVTPSWLHLATGLLVHSGHLQGGVGCREQRKRVAGVREDVGGVLTRCPSNWSCKRESEDQPRV